MQQLQLDLLKMLVAKVMIVKLLVLNMQLLEMARRDSMVRSLAAIEYGTYYYNNFFNSIICTIEL